MKKVLIYSAGAHEQQQALQLEEANEQNKLGNEVHFLYCDQNIVGCFLSGCNKNFCKICKLLQKSFINKYLPKNIIRYSVSELLDKNILKESKIRFYYNSANELREIKYKGVEIGLAALSLYVTSTRNLTPIIDDNSRFYFDSLLRSQVILTLVIEKLHKLNNYDQFVFFNGRIPGSKPMLSIALREGIDFVCTECYPDCKGVYNKDYFYNNIPHNIGPNHEKFIQAWVEAKEKGISREEIGLSFFEGRRNALDTGDKIYVAGQDKSLLVDNWDDEKENIVIFNSSEDEFFAVSGDFEKGKLFPSQIDGIKTIVEHYKDDDTKRFYLRVHPNLKDVNYSYHLDLYKLDYPNLTVIPADSPISSYTLLDNADKVLTFGSTMGIEATYARKPSISIGPSVYDMLNVVYKPSSCVDLWQLIDTKCLPHCYNENVLIYGYYYMGRYFSVFENSFVNLDTKTKTINIFGRKFETISYLKILGSNKLYYIIRYLLSRLFNPRIPQKDQ